MSKVDALRAMREARFAENAARAKTPPPPITAKAPVVAKTPVVSKAPASKSVAAVKPAMPVETDESEQPALCGHRNMGGRTCTRELGHAEKSHRYS